MKGTVTHESDGQTGAGVQIAARGGIQQDVAAGPGAYAVSAYVRSSAMTSGDLWFGGYCYDSNWNPIPIFTVFYGTPVADYQLYSTTFTCQPGTVVIRVFLGDQSSGTVFVDGVVLSAD